MHVQYVSWSPLRKPCFLVQSWEIIQHIFVHLDRSGYGLVWISFSSPASASTKIELVCTNCGGSVRMIKFQGFGLTNKGPFFHPTNVDAMLLCSHSFFAEICKGVPQSSGPGGNRLQPSLKGPPEDPTVLQCRDVPICELSSLQMLI